MPAESTGYISKPVQLDETDPGNYCALNHPETTASDNCLRVALRCALLQLALACTANLATAPGWSLAECKGGSGWLLTGPVHVELHSLTLLLVSKPVCSRLKSHDMMAQLLGISLGKVLQTNGDTNAGT